MNKLRPLLASLALTSLFFGMGSAYCITSPSFGGSPNKAEKPSTTFQPTDGTGGTGSTGTGSTGTGSTGTGSTGTGSTKYEPSDGTGGNTGTGSTGTGTSGTGGSSSGSSGSTTPSIPHVSESTSYRNGTYEGYSAATRAKYASFYVKADKPLTLEEDFSFTLGCEFLVKGYWFLYLIYQSPKTNGQQVFPYENANTVYYEYSANDSYEVEITIDKAYINKDRNSFTFVAATQSPADYLYHSGIIKDTVLLSAKPLNVDPADGNQTYEGSNRYICADSSGYIYSDSVSYAYNGLLNDQTDGEDCLSCFSNSFAMNSPYDENEEIYAELRLYTNLDDFEIGSMYENQYRYFPLKQGAFGYLLQEKGYLDRRNLYMHKNRPNWYFLGTFRLFIPCGFDRMESPYEFDLVIENKNSGDRLVYPISFLRSHEQMGAGINSTYKVKGGSN